MPSTFSSVILAACGLMGYTNAQEWDYEANGPATWAANFPSCGSAVANQSPIDINMSTVVHDTSLPALDFKYDEFLDLTLRNDGRGLSLANVSAEEFFLVNGRKYRLAQAHWHLGSEHTFSQGPIGGQSGVGPLQFAAESHLVHYNADDYNSLSEALSGTLKNGTTLAGVEPGAVAVVAVLYVASTRVPADPKFEKFRNIPFQQMLNSLGSITAANTTTSVTAVNFDGFLPPAGLRDYLTYEGSLTNPPCSPLAQWYVMRERVSVVSDQIERLQTLQSASGKPILENFRPVQPLGGRTVKASFARSNELRINSGKKWIQDTIIFTVFFGLIAIGFFVYFPGRIKAEEKVRKEERDKEDARNKAFAAARDELQKKKKEAADAAKAKRSERQVSSSKLQGV